MSYDAPVPDLCVPNHRVHRHYQTDTNTGYPAIFDIIFSMLCCRMLQFRICVYRPTGSIGPTRRKNSGYPAGFDIIMLILQDAPVPDLCVPAPRVHRLYQAKTDPVYPVEFDIILMMICRRMLRCRICAYLPPGSIGPTRLKRIPDIQPDAGQKYNFKKSTPQRGAK